MAALLAVLNLLLSWFGVLPWLGGMLSGGSKEPSCLIPSGKTIVSVVPPELRSQWNDWEQAYAKARAMVAEMTLLEMNNVTYGIAANLSTTLQCTGISGGAPRLGFPGLCYQDASSGVRGQDGVSAYPAGIHTGASWNRKLAYQRAKHMGAEFADKGANVAFGPVVGPIGRVARGGRNWEGFGADPYLDGQLVIPTISGMQEHVIASVKHYVAYEQETNRSGSFINPAVLHGSANLDDQTLHELYAWPFQDAVNAGAAAVMCSINRVNSSAACENDYTLNQVLKQEFGFAGFVVSDWLAQETGLHSAKSGLDVAMPFSPFWDNGQLAAAVSNGSLSRARLQDRATRTVASWYKTKQNKAPSSKKGLGFGMVARTGLPHDLVNVRKPASESVIMQSAIEGHVLVKNVHHALPLVQPRATSIFGNDAIAPSLYGPDYINLGPIGAQDLWNANWEELGLSTFNAAILTDYQPLTINGTLTTGGGSGGSTAPYISTPFDSLSTRAKKTGTQVFWNFNTLAPQVEAASEVCLVFLNAYASEFWDRAALTDPDGDELVQNVAGQCNNTMVIIHNAGIRLVDAWIEHPNITAVIFAHLPGQDAGDALTSLLYGDISPSGRLPYTVARNESDYGALLTSCTAPPTNLDPQCNFTEGVNIDYRSFLSRRTLPRYEFGYGLTYTTFSYFSHSIDVDSIKATKPETSLFDFIGTVTVSVRNTGCFAAAEVPQLYVRIPGSSTKVLRGFDKVFLEPGDTAKIQFRLRRKDVSRWDGTLEGWMQPKGMYEVEIGASVLNTKLSGSFFL